MNKYTFKVKTRSGEHYWHPPIFRKTYDEAFGHIFNTNAEASEVTLMSIVQPNGNEVTRFRTPRDYDIKE
jgi:hypothetical protein